MRILHVVPTYLPAVRYGGPITSVHGLAAALASRGHDVHVATTNVDGPGNSQVSLDRDVDIDGVQVRYFPSTMLRRLYYSPPMYAWLSDMRWDVVHTHSVFLWPTAAAAHVARRSATPYVISPRGMLVPDLIKKHNALLKRAWIGLIERRNVNCASAVHVTSALEGRELLALGFKPRHMFEVPNGVDLEPEDAECYSEAQALNLPSQYILFLGRISWKKGLDRLVAALAGIADAHLVIAGNDEEDYQPVLEARAIALGVRERIHFVGFLEGRLKRYVLARATVFALPSYSENFGNAALESMACGVPVVVTPEVGLAALVEETRSGRVAAGNAIDLAEALRSIWHDDALRAQMASRARQAARQLSWAAIAERIEAEYFSLAH